MLAALPAAELAALLIETVGDPRDLARLEVACPDALRALCPACGAAADRPTRGLPWLPARRELDRHERAWLRAHGLRVRLHREVSHSTFSFATLTRWTRNGVLHRDGDLPATAWSDAERVWAQDGLRHRGGGRPAQIFVWNREVVVYWWWRGRRVTRAEAESLHAADNDDNEWEC